MNLKLSTKQILIASILLIVIALIAYYLLFFSIRGKNQNASLLSQEIDVYAQNESLRRQNDKAVQEQKEYIEKLDSYFLHQNEVVPFIETIEESGRKTGVEATIGSVGVEGQTLSLRVEASGSWSNIVRFISYVENVPYKVKVQKVNIAKISSPSSFFSPVSQGASSVAPASPSSSGTGPWRVAIDMEVVILE